MTVTGAIMSGSAMPATLPYCAVAYSTVIPPATSRLGMTRAVSEADSEVSMRTADNGSVADNSSLPPEGRDSLPPALKNRTASTVTDSTSDSTRARATPCAPVSEATSPPANNSEKPILKTSSPSSVAENTMNFLRPQNQLRSGA